MITAIALLAILHVAAVLAWLVYWLAVRPPSEREEPDPGMSERLYENYDPSYTMHDLGFYWAKCGFSTGGNGGAGGVGTSTVTYLDAPSTGGRE